MNICDICFFVPIGGILSDRVRDRQIAIVGAAQQGLLRRYAGFGVGEYGKNPVVLTDRAVTNGDGAMF